MEGALFTLVRAKRALKSEDSVVFLRALRRRLGGSKTLVIWDGSPIHKKQVRAFLAAGAAREFQLEALPPYAPDLNPLDAGLWHLLKNVELRNVCCRDLAHLRLELGWAIKRLRHKTDLIQACFAGAGLSLKT